MAEENTDDNFDDAFDSDEFDFLEEEDNEEQPEAEATAPITTATATASEIIRKISTKKLMAVSGFILVVILIFSTFNKKSSQSTQVATNNEKTVTITKKLAQSATTQALPIATAGKENNVTNNPTTTADATALQSLDKSSSTDPTNLQTTKNATTPSEEKSREEMMDLFANTNVNTPDNLASALEKQAKESSTNTNMELYFGNNANNKINKNIVDKEQTEQDFSQQNIQLQQTVESITQEITENVNQIKNLETKISEFSSLLAKINQNIGAIDSKMSGLTETIDSLTQDVSNVKKVIADEDLDLTLNPNKSVTNTQLTYKPPGYSIHAIIPGRAWLKSSAGQIITVAEGDVVGDYGTVAVIDAANNIVRTSSGVSFR